jgi:hypothetical protein
MNQGVKIGEHRERDFGQASSTDDLAHLGEAKTRRPVAPVPLRSTSMPTRRVLPASQSMRFSPFSRVPEAQRRSNASRTRRCAVEPVPSASHSALPAGRWRAACSAARTSSVVIAECRAPAPPLGEGETITGRGSSALHGSAGAVAGSASISGVMASCVRRLSRALDVGACCTSYEMSARLRRPCASRGCILKLAGGGAGGEGGGVRATAGSFTGTGGDERSATWRGQRQADSQAAGVAGPDGHVLLDRSFGR